MSLNRRLMATAFSVAMFLSLPVYASKTEPPVKAATKYDLAATSSLVHKQLAPGGRYEFVTQAERGVIDAKFEQMQSLFDKYGSVATMNQESKILLFNDQESVNAILTNRDSDRRICKSEAPTGSLLPKTTCRTYGDIQRAQQDSQRYMQESMQSGHPMSGH